MTDSAYSLSLASSIAHTTGKLQAKKPMGLIVFFCVALFCAVLYFI
jgi:hypothetical protein